MRHLPPPVWVGDRLRPFSLGLREMCTQLVAGSFAFIGDHAPLFGTRMPFCSDRATGDRRPASAIMARWQGRSRVPGPGPRCRGMDAARLRRELGNPGRLCQGKRGASGRAPMRAILPAPPLPVGAAREQTSGARGQLAPGFFLSARRRCPVFWAARMHAIVPRRRNRAASKQRNSRRRASPGAPVSFGSRRHARYRWRPLKQQRSYRQSGSGNKRYPTLSLTK